MAKSEWSRQYALKLKDPRWQKKRLEIMNRYNFKCSLCGEEDETLHIHHWKYIYGVDPWDYPDGLLSTLCDDCHKQEHSHRKDAEEELLAVLRVGCASYYGVLDLVTALSNQIVSDPTCLDNICFKLRAVITDKEAAKGFNKLVEMVCSRRHKSKIAYR